MRAASLSSAAILLFASVSAAASDAQVSAQQVDERTGKQIYETACLACHGSDGRGQPKAVLGFEPPSSFPDFTNCATGSSENDYIWLAVVHMGGRVRAESHVMPAFADVLTDAEINRVVQYLHSLCSEPRWPRGNLNFPRAFITEKAFPENEVVYTMNSTPKEPGTVENRIDYEHRIGKRAQYEIGVPFVVQQQDPNGSWACGLGDVNAALKYAFFDSNRSGTIAAAGAEVTMPTGKETQGLGEGVAVYEAFGMFDQALPRDAFVQIHAGFERPSNHDIAPNSTYWRTAIGKTFKQHRWGRTWTPMIEVVTSKELGGDAPAQWDLVPQIQVSLSTFQHVLMDVGWQVPVNERDTRGNALHVYVLWDWFDGPLFSMWRAH